jgi:PAS domain S-box-containing protein
MRRENRGMSPEEHSSVEHDFLAGGGELGACARALDWSRTPLGPVAHWPQSLKTSVSICLNSRFPVLIWWGPELVKIYNDAYRPLIGAKHPWALGSPGREVWPEIWDIIGPMLGQVMDRGEATISEDLLLLLERNGYGEECYFSFSYSPIRDEAGQVGGVFSPVAETTERVIGERRLRTLRDLAAVSGTQSKNAKDACIAAAKVLAGNPYDLPIAAIYLFDSKRQDANLVAHTGPPNFPRKVDLLSKGWQRLTAVANGESCALDLSALKLDPLPQQPWGLCPEQAVALPILPANATQPVGFLLGGVSARKRLDEKYRSFYIQVADQLAGNIWKAEALERESQEVETREQQFRVLADSIPQLAWMANADGSIFWYNRRWYEYTGTTFAQMEGWGWQSVHDRETLPAVLDRYKHSIESGEPFEMTFPLRGADGDFRLFLTRALPVRDPAGTIVRWFGTNTDVDAQRKSEAGLRQAEKLAVVGRLAASIAHEINNPLEAVMNLIFLARLTAINRETLGYLASAEEELSRVSQIASQALRFHKQQSSAVATDMVELLDSVLTLYRGKLSRNRIQLNVEAEDCPHLVCYAGEIRQVLANLVGNAADAMPNGGTLRLRVRPVTDWRHHEAGLRITISDTGHGMSADTRRHIYEPFFTTKGEIGTGLGLWVSANIVEKHRGSMHVRSSEYPGKRGTTFTVILPYSGPQIPDADESSAE